MVYLKFAGRENEEIEAPGNEFEMTLFMMLWSRIPAGVRGVKVKTPAVEGTDEDLGIAAELAAREREVDSSLRMPDWLLGPASVTSEGEDVFGLRRCKRR